MRSSGQTAEETFDDDEEVVLIVESLGGDGDEDEDGEREVPGR
jgi:hypothetical protein